MLKNNIYFCGEGKVLYEVRAQLTQLVLSIREEQGELLLEGEWHYYDTIVFAPSAMHATKILKNHLPTRN